MYIKTTLVTLPPGEATSDGLSRQQFVRGLTGGQHDGDAVGYQARTCNEFESCVLCRDRVVSGEGVENTAGHL